MSVETESNLGKIRGRIGQIDRALGLAQQETTLPHLAEHFPTDPNPNAEPLSELLKIHEVISRRYDYKSGIEATIQRLKELKDEQERLKVPYTLEDLASLMRDGLVTPDETRRIGKITEGLVNINPTPVPASEVNLQPPELITSDQRPRVVLATPPETQPATKKAEAGTDSHASNGNRQDSLTAVDSHREFATSKPAESNEYTKPNLLTDRERRFLDFVRTNQQAGIPVTTSRGIQYMWPDETITPDNLNKLSGRFSVFLSGLRRRDNAPELVTHHLKGKGSEGQYILKNLEPESELHASFTTQVTTTPEAGTDSHLPDGNKHDGLVAAAPARISATVIHPGEETPVITGGETTQIPTYERPAQKITLPTDALKIIRLLSRSSQKNPKPLQLSEDARAQMTELLKGTPITIHAFENPDGNTESNMFYLKVAEGHRLTDWVNVPPPTAVEEAEMVGIISSRTAPAFDQIGTGNVLTPEKAKDIPRITMNTKEFTISIGNRTRKIYHARVVQLIQRLQVHTGRELTIDDLAGDNTSDRDREIAHSNFIQLQRDFENDPRNPEIFIIRKDPNGFRFQVNAVIIL